MARKWISRLSLETFLSHSTEKISSGALHFSEKFFHWKILWIGRGYHDFLSNFLSNTTEKSPSLTLLFEKLSGLKKLHQMKYHHFVEQWFSHSTEKFRRGTLHFSEKNFLSKSFMARKMTSRFSLETFLSHSTEKISRGTLVFQKVSGLKKLHKMVYHNFVE